MTKFAVFFKHRVEGEYDRALIRENKKKFTIKIWVYNNISLHYISDLFSHQIEVVKKSIENAMITLDYARSDYMKTQIQTSDHS